MHIMEDKQKIITIIGLVLEGIAFVATIATTIFLFNIEKIRYMGSHIEADMPLDEYNELIELLNLIGNITLVMGIVYLVFFVVNLFLFTGLMSGKFTEEKAKKIYLYQAIWGGLNLLSNQITGILYLISGVQGYNGRKDSIEVREGI